jgi:hypothetical protein
MDTMPTNTESARQLAKTVASNGGCDSFEDYDFNRARDTWVFTCQKPGMTFEIIAFGSPEARSAAIKFFDDSSSTYVTKNFYAVVVVKYEGAGSSDLALASFRK